MHHDIEERYQSERLAHLMTARELADFVNRRRKWFLVMLAVTIIETAILIARH